MATGTRRSQALTMVAALVLAVISGACGQTWGSSAAPDNPQTRGREAFSEYGCATCHTMPGVAVARGKVGPDLGQLAEQRLIAGRIPNTAENLARWIQDPQSVAPGTGMPDTGVSDDDARHLVDFLYGR